MSKITLKITANVTPFNHQLEEGSDPILITKDKVLEVDSEDTFFRRYIALGWAEEVKPTEKDSPAMEEKQAEKLTPQIQADEEEED